MHTKFATTAAAPVFAIATLIATVPAPAIAQPYGPDTCINGFVWREAAPGDNVCVTPAVRDATQAQNANAVANRDPNGAYGSNSCKQGFVWREAFDGDVVCVTPDVRSATKADNAAAASRVAANQAPPPAAERDVILELNGSGKGYVVTDPAGGSPYQLDDIRTRWQLAFAIGPEVHLLQVVGVAETGTWGCKIFLDGKVVVDQPAPNAHCVYAIPD